MVFNFNAELRNFFDKIGPHQNENYSNFLFGVRAKNIVFNYDVECDFVECENLTIKKSLLCKHSVDVKNNINCNVLACNSLKCENLDGYRVKTRKIACKNIKVRGLVIGEVSYCYIKADDVFSEEEKQ